MSASPSDALQTVPPLATNSGCSSQPSGWSRPPHGFAQPGAASAPRITSARASGVAKVDAKGGRAVGAVVVGRRVMCSPRRSVTQGGEAAFPSCSGLDRDRDEADEVAAGGAADEVGLDADGVVAGDDGDVNDVGQRAVERLDGGDLRGVAFE